MGSEGEGLRASETQGYRLDPFRPIPGLAGPHAQTILGRYIRRPRAPAAQTHRLELDDGDFLDLDCFDQPGLPDDGPVVVVLHGLEGCSASGYVLQTVTELAGRGLRAIAMNFRSCSGPPNRLPRGYHAGETTDLGSVLRWARDRFPAAPLGAVGFSLGGSVLLNYLAEQGHDPHGLAAAAAVSVPFDLAAGADALERGSGRIYGRYFVRKLGRKLALKAEQLGPVCDLDHAARARSVREFDDRVTAPLFGFRDAADYYARSSSAPLLDRIRTPTLLLQALDDPFLPASTVPVEAIERNPWLVSGITPRGGHVGFLGGSLRQPHFWAEREAARFLAARLGPASAGSPARDPSRQLDPAESGRHG